MNCTVTYFDCDDAVLTTLRGQPGDPCRPVLNGRLAGRPVIVVRSSDLPKAVKKATGDAVAQLFPKRPTFALAPAVRRVVVEDVDTRPGKVPYYREYRVDFLTGRQETFACPVLRTDQSVELIAINPWRPDVFLFVYQSHDLDKILTPAQLLQIGDAAVKRFALPKHYFIGVCPYNIRLAVATDITPKPEKTITFTPGAARREPPKTTKKGRRQ